MGRVMYLFECNHCNKMTLEGYRDVWRDFTLMKICETCGLEMTGFLQHEKEQTMMNIKHDLTEEELAEIEPLLMLCRLHFNSMNFERIVSDDSFYNGRFHVSARWGDWLPTDFFVPATRAIGIAGAETPADGIRQCITMFINSLIRNGDAYRYEALWKRDLLTERRQELDVSESLVEHTVAALTNEINMADDADADRTSVSGTSVLGSETPDQYFVDLAIKHFAKVLSGG